MEADALSSYPSPSVAVQPVHPALGHAFVSPSPTESQAVAAVAAALLALVEDDEVYFPPSSPSLPPLPPPASALDVAYVSAVPTAAPAAAQSETENAEEGIESDDETRWSGDDGEGDDYPSPHSASMFPDRGVRERLNDTGRRQGSPAGEVPVSSMASAPWWSVEGAMGGNAPAFDDDEVSACESEDLLAPVVPVGGRAGAGLAAAAPSPPPPPPRAAPGAGPSASAAFLRPLTPPFKRRLPPSFITKASIPAVPAVRFRARKTFLKGPPAAKKVAGPAAAGAAAARAAAAVTRGGTVKVDHTGGGGKGREEGNRGKRGEKGRKGGMEGSAAQAKAVATPTTFPWLPSPGEKSPKKPPPKKARKWGLLSDSESD
jgi:hypothetical protein